MGRTVFAVVVAFLMLAGGFVGAVGLSKWSAEDRCRDLRPGEKDIRPHDIAADDNIFWAVVWSKYGATSGAVIDSFRSDQPKKQLAELNVLECTFLDWSAQQRAKLSR